MPTWIWIVVIVAILLFLFAVASSGRRRAVADGDTVVSGGGGAGAGFLLGVVFMIAVFIVLAVGMWQFNWFGAHGVFQNQAPAITTPGASPSLSSPSPSASAS